MASGTAASRVTGQIRTILLAWALGTTGYAANAYQAGSMIPQVIYTLVSGGIFNAVLVPQIVRTLKDKDAETKLNKLITLSITMLLGVTLLMAVCTPLLTKLYVNGGPDTMALANAFTVHAADFLLWPLYGDRADSGGQGPFRHLRMELGWCECHQLHRLRRVHRAVRPRFGTARRFLVLR